MKKKIYKTPWKRYIAFMLACLMIFTSVPLDAFAAADIADYQQSEGQQDVVLDMTDDEQMDSVAEGEDEGGDDQSGNGDQGGSGDQGGDGTGEKPAEEGPRDLTEQITLSLNDWNYNGTSVGEAEVSGKTVDLSGQAVLEKGTYAPLQVVLQYSALGVKAGDFFYVKFPESLKNIRGPDANADGNVTTELVTKDGATYLKVTFTKDNDFEEPEEDDDSEDDDDSEQGGNSEDGDTTGGSPEGGDPADDGEKEPKELPLEGSIQLSFEAPVALNVTFTLQENNTYTVMMPKEALETASKNTIHGTLDFEDGEWRQLLRPNEFHQKIKITPVYKKDGELVEGTPVYAQDGAPQENFYLGMDHDGEGAGQFNVLNVPNLVKVDGVEYNVDHYEVTAESDMDYYSVTSFHAQAKDDNTIGQLTFNVEKIPVKLMPSVVGDNEPTKFNYVITLENPVTGKTMEKRVEVTSPDGLTVEIPVGVKYSIKQIDKLGYKLIDNYQTTITPGTNPEEPETPDVKEESSAATGITQIGQTIVVKTQNIMQDKKFDIHVTWLDNNNSKNRPAAGLTKDDFVVEYAGPDGEWHVFDNSVETLEQLGVTAGPSFTDLHYEKESYRFGNLPGADINGNELKYRVSLKEDSSVSQKYNQSFEPVEGKTDEANLILCEKTTFNASVEWLDTSDDVASRPKNDTVPLVLMRRISGGEYEIYPLGKDADGNDITVKDYMTTDGETGNALISVPGLDRYDDQNREYDYVVVQGTVNADGAVVPANLPGYKTYYNNAGNHSNDTKYCHNGGTIIERMTGETTFEAKKVWKDTKSNAAERPTSVVTLWRYVVPASGEHSIDQMFRDNQAARVIYRKLKAGITEATATEHDYEEVLLSYELSKGQDQIIKFDHSTIPGLPEGFKLPARDEQGRPYVYFVRETVEGYNYDTVYSKVTGEGDSTVTTTYAGGAPDGGVISNIYREKAAININKVWKCPSSLANIADTKVQMVIEAPVAGDSTKNYKQLVVYSAEANSYTVLEDKWVDDKSVPTEEGKDPVKVNYFEEATTLGGFQESIASLDIKFYANIYDSEGRPFDMTNARIKEVKVFDPTKGTDGDWVTVGEDGIFGLGDDIYQSKSEHLGLDNLEVTPKEFFYRESNVITGYRDYTLRKSWSGTPEFSKVEAVYMKIMRRSTNPEADEKEKTFYTVKDYEKVEVKNNGTNSWQTLLEGELSKYDDNGYTYVYRAEEVGLKLYDSVETWDVYVNNHVSETKNVSDKKEYTLAEMESILGLSHDHARGEDFTKVTNGVWGSGDPYFRVTKEWTDNGDNSMRQNVIVHMYDVLQLARALEEYQDPDEEITLKDLEDKGLLAYPIRLTSGLKEDGTSNGDEAWSKYLSTRAVEKAVRPNPKATKSDGSEEQPGDGEEQPAEEKPVDALLIARDDLWVTAYRALEYSVGESGIPATYTVGELKQIAADIHITNDNKEEPQASVNNGKVSSANRRYRINSYFMPNENTFYLNNTRIGDTKLVLDKLWHDENNREKLRTDVTFTITRNGKPLGLNFEGDEEAKEKLRAELNNVNFVIYNYESLVKTGDDADENGIVTVKDDAGEILATWNLLTGQVVFPIPENGSNRNKEDSEWKFYLDNLPMFTDMAIPYTYTIAESMDHNGNYLMEMGPVTVADTNPGILDDLTFTHVLTNTVYGETYHKAYKVWKDIATGGEDRPDLYISVYRYLKKEAEEKPTVDPKNFASYEVFTDYKDQTWTPGNKEGTDKDWFDWQIELKNIPAFNEKGEEYVYRFEEEMNNGGKTIHGTYVKSYELVRPESGPEYEVFTNTLTGTVTIVGDKRWTGMSEYRLSEDDYPTPTIELYRSLTSYGVLTAEDVEKLTASADPKKKIVLVNTTVMKDSKTGFGFPDTSWDTGKMNADDIKAALANKYLVNTAASAAEPAKYELPKFDENGERYQYSYYEHIETTDGQTDVADSLYTQISAGGTLTNTFVKDINRRSIVVDKAWNRNLVNTSRKENQYPSITYTLYRYLMGTSTQMDGYADATEAEKIKFEESHAEKIAEKVVTADEIAAKIKNGQSISCVFDDLLVYSPTGVQYGYYIEETDINGYSILYNGDDKNSSHDVNHIDIRDLPENALVKGEQDRNVNNVGTENVYDKAGSVTIRGFKDWNDYGNSKYVSGSRPASINIQLRRTTLGEAGQNNAISAGEADVITLKTYDSAEKVPAGEKDPYIIWTVSAENPSRWAYTIHNLEKYAPNGFPYVYGVREEPIEGYKDLSTKNYAGTDKEGDVVEISNITNEFSQSYTVRKIWVDGNNKYGLRPETVTMVLQRSRDGEKWEYIGWETGFGKKNAADKWIKGLPHAEGVEEFATYYDSENGEWVTTDAKMPVVSINLSAQYVMANTAGNTWTYTFTNLPKYYDLNTKGEWKYRCIETMIGHAAVEAEHTDLANPDKITGYRGGAYTRTYTEQSATMTKVQNKLESTSLFVEKDWQQDEDDMYSSRPESLEFVLQVGRYNVETVDGKEVTTLVGWDDLMMDGKRFTFSMPDENGKWQALLQDLPVARVDQTADGEVIYYQLHFRAKEIVKAGNTVIENAENYSDKTGYEINTDLEHDHKYNTALSRNESTIRNELIRREQNTIKVTKQWNREQGDEVSATFELLYHIEGEPDDKWHCFGDADEEHSGTIDGCRSEHSEEKKCVLKTLTSTKSGTESFEWKNLPMYNRQGKELTYKVIEYPVKGYKTEVEEVTAEGAAHPTEYTFTNIEMKDFSVEKIWKTTDYAQKLNGKYSATFVLQKKEQTKNSDGTYSWGDWTNVADSEVTLASEDAADKDAFAYTWKALPKYTVEDGEIIYRAWETKINGIDVTDHTNGSYIVTYDKENTESFDDVKTTATNRMVYGFVNMSKTAAFLNPAVTSDAQKMEQVCFNIYAVDGETESLYAEKVYTDTNGNLICNEGDTYGTTEEHTKLLIPGTYRLKEVSIPDAKVPYYSLWSQGVDFTISLDTVGEHGTMWIYTDNTVTVEEASKPGLSLNTIALKNLAHEANDTTCRPILNAEGQPAYNLESRGVLQFTKTDENKALLTHLAATGEKRAYFGVFSDENCSKQVAAMMADTDGKTMVLSSLNQEYTENYSAFHEIRNAAGAPYLRRDSNGQLTLLSGTYYIKELVAPAGYELDSEVRTAVIASLHKTEIGADLTNVYANNKGTIEGKVDYQWSNTPNIVKLYKKDQYGRDVLLAENGYLELKVKSEAGENNTFMTGEDTIRLYQDAAGAAKDSNGNAFTTEGRIPNITYANGVWTITGLFAIEKIYELSEPENSVGTNYLQAETMTFKVDENGALTAVTAAVEKENPLTAIGNDFENYYHAQAGTTENQIVLRDDSRHLKSVELLKLDSVTKLGIENIFFELYKYDSKSGETFTNAVPVLESGVYLTTDENGNISFLSDANKDKKNLITGCALQYGLDAGNYYFKEVERGASDCYRLIGEVFFSITPRQLAEGEDAADSENYATVSFETNDYVSQEGKTGKVENNPVTTEPKTLVLTKVDSENAEKKLAGARFTLSYVSLNEIAHGAHENVTVNCVTDAQGELYLADADWEVKVDTEGNGIPVDISKKGSYTLVEIKAPEGYMTQTESDTQNTVTMMTFDVDSENKIVNVKHYNGTTTMVATATEYVSSVVTTNVSEDEDVSLNAVVKNEKTLVKIDKLNDLISNQKQSSQTILGGEALSGAELAVYDGDTLVQWLDGETEKDLKWTTNGTYTVPAGTLIEDKEYQLKEVKTPNGYLTAEPITFKLHGTVDVNGTKQSQLYVKSGSEWTKVQNINQNTQALTMVDEVIIAPVDMQKVLGPVGDKYSALKDVEFKVESLNGPVELGTAVTDANGYLVWKSIKSDAIAAGLIYTLGGKKVTSNTDNDAIGKTIVLRENENGYRFTETYAPANAYNNAAVEGTDYYDVKVTAENYVTFRDTEDKSKVYVDIKKANANDDAATAKTATITTNRNNTANAEDVVNAPYHTTFELYKYDAEHPEIAANHKNYEKIGLKNVTFALYKGVGTTGTKVGTYTTGEHGLLQVPITEKGTYTLVEESTVTGYIPDTSKTWTFTVDDADYDKYLTYDETNTNKANAYNSADHDSQTMAEKHTKQLNGTTESDRAAATDDFGNRRKHGSVILTKRDADNVNKFLNGVEYILFRNDPEQNVIVDGWFTAFDKASALTVITGNTYEEIATAEDKSDFDYNRKNTGTSNPGQLILQDLQWGTYTLIEKKALEGYILPKDEADRTFTFTIDAENCSDIIYVTDDGKTIAANTKNQLTVLKTDLDENQKEGAQFVLYQVDADTDKAAEDAFYFVEDPASDTKAQVLTAGRTTIYQLPAGKYVLHETLAPKGYELAQDILLEMDENGKVISAVLCTVKDDRTIESGDSVALVTSEENGKNLITVQDTPIQLNLTKALTAGPALTGNEDVRGKSTFVITGSFADGSGKQTFTGNIIETEALFVGGEIYEITETKAPDGYEIRTTKVKIRVNTDGTVDALNSSNAVIDNHEYLTADNSSTDGIAELTYTDKPIEISLKKTGTNTNGASIDEDVLTHALFNVTGKMVKEDGTAVETNGSAEGLTTLDFETKLSKRLIGGETYRVEETHAPYGYKITDPFYIKIDLAGNIIGRGPSADKLTAVTEGEKLIVEDEPNTIRILKTDDNGALAGAKFTLTPMSAAGNFVNVSESNKPENAGVTTWSETMIAWTSTEAAFEITNHLRAGQQYKLTEIERVPNHEWLEMETEQETDSVEHCIILTMNEKGEVSIVTNATMPNNDGLAASVDTSKKVQVTVLNPIIRGSVVLTKYYKEGSGFEDEGAINANQLLPGAIYRLICVSNKAGLAITEVKTDAKAADGYYAFNVSGTTNRFVTDQNGQIRIKGLPEGTYRFIEVDAPKAYHINNKEPEDYVGFEIVDNELAHTETAPQIDTRINAKISLYKYNDADGLLKNAVFDVMYSETGAANSYQRIGQMTTGSDGEALFTKGKYPGETYAEGSEGEGLRRGYYQLVEFAAEDQMLNLTNKQRNTISFVVGNDIDKTYVVNKDLDAAVNNPTLMKLTEEGVKDIPIPEKKVTVSKIWKGEDYGMSETFRPSKITVTLYRSCNGKTAQPVEGSQYTVELKEENNWTVTWDHLPAYVNEADATGKETTYLYTYTVKETDKPDWYLQEVYSYETQKTGVFEPNALDGDTTAKITNDLNGGAQAKILTIQKTLGGGSVDDTFYVRVKLTKNDQPVGNHIDGYYLDQCTVKKDGVNVGTVTPDTDGWMMIQGKETIEVIVPAGYQYSVEEKCTDGTYKAVSGNHGTGEGTGLEYSPRYDAKASGTVGTAAISTTIRNAVHKSLNLNKLDAVTDAPIAGAVFEVQYVKLSGSDYVGENYTRTFTTNDSGQLIDPDTGKAIDLTNQGTYTIKEIKAAKGYITPTDNDGTVKTIAVITVNADDIMSISNQYAALTTVSLENYDSEAKVVVKNEKTTAGVFKAIDYANGKPLAEAKLEVYEGSVAEGNKVAFWDTTTGVQILAEGTLTDTDATLKEDTLYVLHEVAGSAPVGYLETEDVYFILQGTYTYKENGTEKRVSRILITDNTKTAIGQNAGGTIYGKAGVLRTVNANIAGTNGALGIVDDTIIVPVTLKKVLEGRFAGEANILLKDVTFMVSDLAEGVDLGEAKTGTDGYLVWKKTDNGHTAGEIIRLQQNAQNGEGAGYRFTETEAPSNAYNDGRDFTINPTDDQFREYLADNSKFLNIRNNTMETKTAGFNTADSASSVVNEAYKSTVTLHKYDADEEANKADIAETEFTLYKAIVNGDTWTQGAAVTDAYLTGETSTTGHADGKFVTDAEGNLSIVIPNKGNYILKETGAATGYQLDATNPVTFKFTLVDKADTSQRANNIFGHDQTNELKVDEDGVPNQRIMGSIEWTKVDPNSDEKLDNVVYILTRTGEVGTDETHFLLQKEKLEVTTGKNYMAVQDNDGNWTFTVSDGTPGHVKVEGLNWGTYTVTEKTELSGYVRDTTEYPVEITRDNLEHVLGTGNPKTVKNQKNVIKLHKFGELPGENDTVITKDLKGAVFEIHEGDACSDGCAAVGFYDAASKKLTTEKSVEAITSGQTGDSYGTVTIYGLPTNNVNDEPKTYHLVETTAPLGYKIAPPVVFTIDRDGKIQYQKAVDGVDTMVDNDEVPMTDQPIKIYIEKVGEDMDTKLADARFTLTDVCEENCSHLLADETSTGVENITTDETGRVMIPLERVIAGHSYQLLETKAPDGYECTAVVTFTVKNDGTVVLDDTKTTGGYVNAEKGMKTAVVDDAGTMITVSNEKIRAKITKVDFDTKAPLKGVIFTIKPNTGSKFSDGTTDVITLAATDSDGVVDIPVAKLIHGDSYILTESKIGENDSYRYAKNVKYRRVKFTVALDGTISIDPADSDNAGNEFFTTVSAGDQTNIVVTNQQIQLKVDKIDQATGNPIKGVTLKISYYDTDDSKWKPFYINGVNSTDGTWTTDGTTRVFQGNNLVRSTTYMIEEETAPEAMEGQKGYNPITERFYFYIDQYGKISESGTEADEDGNIETGNSTAYVYKNPTDGKTGDEYRGLEVKITNAAYSDLKITKKGSDGALLKNVELRLDVMTAEGWKYVKLAEGKAVVASHTVVTTENASEAVLTTSEDGIANFQGLPNGKYRLTELKTTQGYNLLSQQLIIEIDRNTETYVVKDSSGNVLNNLSRVDDSDTISMTLVNQKGFALPQTGTTTPKLPWPAIPLAVLFESLVLYLYQKSANRRKEEVSAS